MEPCIPLTPEQAEGPYYIDELLYRHDVTEDRHGVPLELTISVIDIVSRERIADAAVDIWHCDALGDYSGILRQRDNADTRGERWLRGVQLTDETGAATFSTIYPGWYVGRCTHIHLKVHCGGSAEDGSYIGGTEEHTGQIYFDDEMSDAIAQIEPYARRLDVYRTRNEEDTVLAEAGIENPALYVRLTANNKRDLSAGFIGRAVVGVETAEN